MASVGSQNFVIGLGDSLNLKDGDAWTEAVPGSPQDGMAEREKTPGERIRRARKARQWSQQQLAQQMRLHAGKRGDPAPAVSSIKPMISRWEHGKAEPNEYNRRLLAAVLEVSVEHLGLTEDPDFVW